MTLTTEKITNILSEKSEYLLQGIRIPHVAQSIRESIVYVQFKDHSYFESI